MKHICINHAELNKSPEQLQSFSWKKLLMTDESK